MRVLIARRIAFQTPKKKAAPRPLPVVSVCFGLQSAVPANSRHAPCARPQRSKMATSRSFVIIISSSLSHAHHRLASSMPLPHRAGGWLASWTPPPAPAMRAPRWTAGIRSHVKGSCRGAAPTSATTTTTSQGSTTIERGRTSGSEQSGTELRRTQDERFNSIDCRGRGTLSIYFASLLSLHGRL